MNSFNLDDDIWSQIISSDPEQYQTFQLQDQITIQDSIPDVSNNVGEQQPPNVNDNSIINKKKMHREIEKQRRKKMDTLFSSLRSLLPLEFIKVCMYLHLCIFHFSFCEILQLIIYQGTLCWIDLAGQAFGRDHVNEATNYIKHLENKTKIWDAKRDQLNFLSSSSTTSSSHGNGSTNNCSANYVTVSCTSMGQVEVMFSTTDFDQAELQLSCVLKLLLEEGLTVVRCVSTKVNERLLHTIQSQVL